MMLTPENNSYLLLRSMSLNTVITTDIWIVDYIAFLYRTAGPFPIISKMPCLTNSDNRRAAV